MLAPDVLLVSDGGGRVAAIRHPAEGRHRVVALLARFSQLAPDEQITTVPLNDAVSARIDLS